MISFRISFISVFASQSFWHEKHPSRLMHSMLDEEKRMQQNRQYQKRYIERVRGDPVLYERYLARRRRNDQRYRERRKEYMN